MGECHQQRLAGGLLSEIPCRWHAAEPETEQGPHSIV